MTPTPALGFELIIWKAPPGDGIEREGLACTTWGNDRVPLEAAEMEDTGTSWGKDMGTIWARPSSFD